MLTACLGREPVLPRWKALWKIPGGRLLAFLVSYLFLKRYNGVVWLRK